MLKVKRIADGVIFGYNGPDKPPANKIGFVVFDDLVPESEPATTGQKLAVDNDAPVFPRADDKVPELPKTGLQPPVGATDKDPAGDYVGQSTAEPKEVVLSPYDEECKVLDGMKTRASIAEYVDEKFGATIPKMNRKTSEILKDAKNIVHRNLKESVSHNKE